MVIAGNFQCKSKATHKETNDGPENNVTDDENDSEENQTFINSHPQTINDNSGKASSDLEENDIVLAEEFLQNFLIITTGTSNSGVYDVISKHGKKLKVCCKTLILKKNETGSGFCIIMAGKVNIMTSDESEVLSTLTNGDIFGDVSTLFGIPVTANVIADTEVTLIKLSKEFSLKLFKDCLPDLDVIDWFIQRRYLPTGSDVDSGRVYRRLALHTLKDIHLFQTWTEEMIKKLVLSFDNNILTLYPKNSTMVLENDSLTSLYIVTHGDIAFSHDSRIIHTINITPLSDPFVFTEAALLVDEKISPVTMKALSNCQVIQLNKDWILDILDSFPEEREVFLEGAKQFQSSLSRLGQVYLENEAYLQIEMLCCYVKHSILYSSFTMQEIWLMILDADLQEVEDGTNAILEIQSDENESLVVVRGEIACERKRATLSSVGDEMQRVDCDEPDETGESIDSVDLDCAKGGSEEDKCATNKVFAVGSVIDMKHFTEQTTFFKTKSQCLILKIRRTVALDDMNDKKNVVSDQTLDMV